MAASDDLRAVPLLATLTLLTLLTPAASATGPAAAQQPAGSAFVSVTPDGRPGDGWSTAAAIDDDGSVVAFTSTATDLVPDTSGAPPLERAYVRDVERGVTELVSRSIDGAPVAGIAGPLSSDGRFAAFTAVEDDVLHNGAPRERLGTPILDAFVLDRRTGTVEHVSRPPDGREPLGRSAVGGISDDARYVAVASADEPGSRDVSPLVTLYVVDRATGARTQVHQGRAGLRGTCELSSILALSGDGRRLVAGDCGAAVIDVASGNARLVPFSNRLPQVAAGDGRHVGAGNLVVDVDTGLVRRADLPPRAERSTDLVGQPEPVVDVAAGGRFALTEDLLGTLVWQDLAAARTVPVAGQGAHGVLSDDGRWVAWDVWGQVQRWGPAPVAPPAPPSTEGWIAWLYAHALNRWPSSADIAYWSGQFRSGAPASSLAAAVQRSPEGLEWWVRLLHARMNIAGQNPASVARWRDRLASGATTTDVAVGMLLETAGGFGWSTRDVLRAAYPTLLGRDAGDRELDGWLATVRGGAPLAGVLGAIAASPEARQHRVLHLYLDTLLRTPDPGGLAYWSDRLRDGDELALRIQLLASLELRARPGSLPPE